MAFELPRALYEEIVTHVREGLPNEACGVLAGDDGRAVRVYRMRNAERSPVVYRFDEREQLEVFDEIEEKGWSLLAFFHSHTHTEAYPSPTDIERAGYPEWWYLIVSLKAEVPMMRAYRIIDGEVTEDGITLERG